MGTLQNDRSGKPVPLDIIGYRNPLYWSLSHSENYTTYALSYTPAGIDIS